VIRYGKYLKGLMDRYGLEGQVHFMGQLNEAEMIEAYKDAEVYILPSFCENSPNSLGEAMLLGTPVVAAKVGGIPDLINEDEGILYEDGKMEDMAWGIEQVLKFEGDFGTKIRKARGHALFNHDPEANYHTLLQIYDRVSRG